MNDTEFEEAMKRAGVRQYYRDRDKRLSQYLESDKDPLLLFMQKKSNVDDHIREHNKHIVIVDKNGSGQHVMNLIVRGLLLYSIATTMTSLPKLVDIVSDYERRRHVMEEIEDTEVFAVMMAHTSHSIDASRVEAILREAISDGAVLMLHVEKAIEQCSTFSQSFRGMIASNSIQFQI
jgi:hypothetical protein